MIQHVMDRRRECAYVNINYNIHMEYRTRQVEPDISIMKSNQGPIAEDNGISLLVRKLGTAENFFYGSMDRSRKGLLHQVRNTKAKKHCKSFLRSGIEKQTWRTNRIRQTCQCAKLAYNTWSTLTKRLTVRHSARSFSMHSRQRSSKCPMGARHTCTTVIRTQMLLHAVGEGKLSVNFWRFVYFLNSFLTVSRFKKARCAVLILYVTLSVWFLIVFVIL